MRIHLEIGELTFHLESDASPIARRVMFQVETPWFDFNTEQALDRSKSLHLCVLCDNKAKACECGDAQVLINPHEATVQLTALDHEMFHFLTETECDEEHE